MLFFKINSKKLGLIYVPILKKMKCLYYAFICQFLVYLKLIKIDITFLLLSMPKERNHHPLNKPKIAAAIYLEECHAFDSGQLSSLTHNNNFDALSS